VLARGRCSERLAGAEAYLPVLEALDDLLRQKSGESFAEVMKSAAPTWYVHVATLTPAGSSAELLRANVRSASQERMKRELTALLQQISQIRPIVLFFDDLHWADASTIDLLTSCDPWPAKGAVLGAPGRRRWPKSRSTVSRGPRGPATPPAWCAK
jgi:hypothetical protein